MTGIAAILPAEPGSSGQSTYILSRNSPQYDVFLDKSLIEDRFDVFYNNFLKTYNLRPLAFDLYRQSLIKFTQNDRTIYSCIALESIFVPNKEKSKKPFILNGMKIMGFESSEIKLIDKLIDYRNAIMHADIKKQIELISIFTTQRFEESFNVARKILNKYIENPWS